MEIITTADGHIEIVHDDTELDLDEAINVGLGRDGVKAGIRAASGAAAEELILQSTINQKVIEHNEAIDNGDEASAAVIRSELNIWIGAFESGDPHVAQAVAMSARVGREELVGWAANIGMNSKQTAIFIELVFSHVETNGQSPTHDNVGFAMEHVFENGFVADGDVFLFDESFNPIKLSDVASPEVVQNTVELMESDGNHVISVSTDEGVLVVYHDNPGQWTDDGWDADGDGIVEAGEDDWGHGDPPPARPWDPVIIDLNGDGVGIVSKGEGVYFDVDADGYNEKTAWVAPDDGFLVVDLDTNGEISSAGGDGDITDIREIAFSEWMDGEVTDLQALVEATDENGQKIFDTNGDEVLSSADSVWGSMKVWSDADQDGLVDSGELMHLSEHGITSIGLSHEGSDFHDTVNDTVLAGNIIHGFSSMEQNGITNFRSIMDVSLARDEIGLVRTENSYGFRLDFEDGSVERHATIQAHHAANLNLTNNEFHSATGDSRNNLLYAHVAQHSVVLSGGNGTDHLVGGIENDLLHGGTGYDVEKGGQGDDIYIFNVGDGTSIIDDSAFEITDTQGNITTQTGSSGLSTQLTIPNGKGTPASDVSTWVSDTQSGATVKSVAAGDNDVLLFGQGVPLSKLAMNSNVIVDGYGRETVLDQEMNITFLEDNGTQFSNDNIMVKNWGSGDLDTGLERFEFTGGPSISLEKMSLAQTGTSGSDILKTSDQTIDDTARTWINGLGGSDTIEGSNHGDVLIGGAGNDILSGNRLSSQSMTNDEDLFVLGANHGQDTITDFQLGEDKIFYDIEGAERDDISLIDSNNGLKIVLNDGSEVVLPGITVEEFEEAEEGFHDPLDFWAS